MKHDKWFINTTKKKCGIYVPCYKAYNCYTDVITGFTKVVDNVIPLECVYGTARYFRMMVDKCCKHLDEDTKVKLTDFLTTKSHGSLIERSFKHIKTSDYYSVVQVLPDCTNDTEWDSIVIYSRANKIYARRLSEFLKKFKYNG